MRAYVGLGANVGDAAATLEAAVRSLAALPFTRLRRVSSLWATAPVGVVDQPEFHNAVVALDVPAGTTAESGATALLAALKQLERAFGRQRREHWGPRELDLDLLVFGRARLSVSRPSGAESNDPARTGRPLVVPHPEAQARLFVLEPLAELAPALVPPGWGQRVSTARERRRAIEGPDAARRIAAWGEPGWIRLEPERAG
ncbi:MAG TPA: 2-amino-4-hydroxy-6-hydroxymethyldihydropteridine diphosphokinase [Vitreimonas sp.]|nr:2-amino-4-hydroxy-6-hydroxymethyldihydropteridine diphosphokinase [Vitreimonas sp.]